MANNLVLKSQRQIKTDILVKIISLLGLNDVIAGSVLDVLTDAVAQEDFAQYVAMAQISRLVNLDDITGTDLDNKAFEYGLTRNPALKSSGAINILRPAGFVKVATSFYAGSPPPLAGNTKIDVNDASNILYASSGTLILGRGTVNEETVNYSVAPTNFTNYWEFTLTTPLANNHSTQETVILSQGIDQSIIAGTSVQVPSSGTSAAIVFSTTEAVTLLAGEPFVSVDVIAALPGDAGNISTNAIFGTAAWPATAPFAGVQAVNPSKFTTGQNRQSDDSLRDAIRNWVQSLSRGVQEAIKNAIVGLVDPVTAKRVVSSNIILPQTTNEPVLVYIDDGTGFEPSFASVGFESIVDSAAGKEKRLQLNHEPQVKAQLESNSAEPFNMSSSPLTLQYVVGSDTETITFQSSDFEFPSLASAYEIVQAINSRAFLIEARTSEGGSQIVITGVADVNEDIQVTGGTANPILGFPTILSSTLNLFIDDILQSKDGLTAFLDSANSSPYNFTSLGGSSWPLNIVIDGKTSNPQIVTFVSGDFADAANATAEEVVAVINGVSGLAGASAVAIDNSIKVRVTSNTPLSTESQLHVTGGSANSILGFSTSPFIGQNGDYTFNRELGTIELKTPLQQFQTATAGSLFTRAFLRAGSSELYSPLNGQTLIILVDGGGPQTITFDNSFVGGKTAAQTASFINQQLLGATANVRLVGLSNFLEIATNSYAQGIGSIEILSSSTANTSFAFVEDQAVLNQRPNRAFQISGNAGPFNFAQDDNLVIILDNDIVNKTYSIPMDFYSSVSTSGSNTSWHASNLPGIFPNSGELINYFIAFITGANTSSGTVSDVIHVSGNTWKYLFSSAPVGLVANFVAGDLVTFGSLTDNSNNGFFVITAVDPSGNYIEVTNTLGVVASLQSGTAQLSEKRRVSGYTASGGMLTVSSAFSSAPSNSDPFILIPSTIINLVDFINNVKISAFSLSGFVEGASNNTHLQLSSRSNGSDGYIEVSGGQANLQLGFSTLLTRGLAAYSYYTGLLALVHKTIYGDDTDLVSFPGIGAAGITFYELAPTVREVSVSLIAFLNPGITITSLQNSIQSAISSYINNLGVGDPVIIEEIRSAVIAIPGIRDVSLSTPTANIAIAANQLARTRSSLIIISGE